MHQKKIEMLEFMKNFEDTPDRLLKYIEILLEGEDASPFCYQDTMSFRHICFSVNTYCNKNCTWCYRRNPSFKKILNKQMPIEKLRKIITNTKGRFREVYIGGMGEPLLYPDYDAAVDLARKISNKVILTTNGSLLSEERIDLLEDAGLTDIQISIDCFDEDMQRKHRGTSLTHLLEMCKYINNSRMRLRINSVVNNVSYPYIFNAVEMLKDCDKLHTFHIIPMYQTIENISSVSNDKMIKLLKKLEGDVEKYALGITKKDTWTLYPSSDGISLYPSIEMKKKRNICFTCFESPYINTDGELVPCARQMTWKGVDATVGFEEAWNHPDLLKFRENMLKGDYPEFCGKLCYLKEKK